MVFDSIGKGRGMCGLGLERAWGFRAARRGVLQVTAKLGYWALPKGRVNDITKSLILAQNERWRRVLSMQVEREPTPQGVGESGERVSNT